MAMASDHKVHSDGSYTFVAAIDLGTAFSGYAFASIAESEVINMNKNWSGGNFESYKTPTSVLFGPKGFLEFGYPAEAMYSNSGNNSMDLFRHFKMMLYNQQITRSLQITATNGNRRAALDVFAEALKFLKKHMVEAIDRSIASNVEDYMVRWVITLPAIWGDEAKQFMREAALQARLTTTLFSKQLVLALEPEVASIFCRELPIHPDREQADRQSKFEIDSEYLIIDAGGGTVDITAHRVLGNGFVREILQPCGGPWGGIQVDKAFEELLTNVFSNRVVNGLKKNQEQWLKLMLSFELLKKSIISENTDTFISLDMNYQFCKLYEDVAGLGIEKSLTESNNKHVYFVNGRLIIDHETSVSLFQPTVKKIAEYVQQLLQQAELQEISFVLLVGGFGTCEVLQSTLRDIMPPDITLIVPDEAQLAIAKGAVKFGLNSKLVESRFARKTYGIDIEPKFQSSRHEARRKVVKDQIAYCEDVFLKFIDKGTPVSHDEITSKRLRARTANQPSMTFDIYCCDETDLDDVEYVTDSKFTRVGGLTVFMPDQKGGINREVEVQFQFGGTEILVSARDITSGEVATTTVDMLLP